MLILSLDSCGGGCGACVWRDGKILAHLEEKMERGQDAQLIPLVQETMTAAGVDFAALDRLAVTRGPGSFTGLRIGLAAARGLGLAARKTVIGIDRFSLYRAQQPEGEILVALESRRLELYARFFPAAGEGQEMLLMPPAQIAAFLAPRGAARIAGDTAPSLAGTLDPARFLPLREPEAVTAAALAAKADPQDPAFRPLPLYLRAPDVTMPSCGTC